MNNHIFKVEETRIKDKNYRIVFVANVDRYNVQWNFFIAPEDDIYYNYYDVNRIYFVLKRNKEFIYA